MKAFCTWNKLRILILVYMVLAVHDDTPIMVQCAIMDTMTGPLPIDLFCSFIFMSSVTDIQLTNYVHFFPLD